VSMVALILLVLAFLLFALRAVGVAHSRFDLLAAGLAAWVLSVLIGGTMLR
jgi:hypothetical protein